MNALVEAVALDRDIELAKARMQLALYRQTLIDHDILPPDKTGEELLEMWRTCAAAIDALQKVAANMGTSIELLRDWSR